MEPALSGRRPGILLKPRVQVAVVKVGGRQILLQDKGFDANPAFLEGDTVHRW